MAAPVKFEISITIEINEDGVLHTCDRLLVDGEQIGLVSRLRVDHDSSEVLPAIQVDMLRGLDMAMLDQNTQEAAQKYFDQLRRVPGLRCVMPAPREP